MKLSERINKICRCCRFSYVLIVCLLAFCAYSWHGFSVMLNSKNMELAQLKQDNESVGAYLAALENENGELWQVVDAQDKLIKSQIDNFGSLKSENKNWDKQKGVVKAQMEQQRLAVQAAKEKLKDKNGNNG